MRMIVAFEKTEQVRHVGHLDLMRTMQRALRRSGLPIRYSQGFNPHVLLSFASPLPVGASGSLELMEVSMERDISITEFVENLAPAMPASLPLVRVRAVDEKHPKLMASLKTAEYEATFPKRDESLAMATAIPALLAKKEINAIRKTKSGEKPCDIRPMLHTLWAEEKEDSVRFVFRAALNEAETLKPDLLLATLAEEAGVSLPDYRVRRICLYAEKDGLPVSLMELP